jgi:putative ferrous iron transport protein C
MRVAGGPARAMLMDIKGYLADRGPASLSEIAAKLSTDPDAIRPMLDHWMRKGKVRRSGTATRCHGCTSCAPADVEFYEWIPAPARDAEPKR